MEHTCKRDTRVAASLLKLAQQFDDADRWDNYDDPLGDFEYGEIAYLLRYSAEALTPSKTPTPIDC